MKTAIESIIRAAQAANPEREWDYQDAKTGLLMCGKCHTPKRIRITILDEERVVPVMCLCTKREYELQEQEEKAKKRQQRIAERRRRCFGAGGRKASFVFEKDDGKDKKTMQIARGYVDWFDKNKDTGKGILFLGPTGTGKTFAACCIANALLDKGYSVKVTTFADVSAALQGTWQKDEVYEAIEKYDLLVLDDLGAERDSSYMDEIVYTVVDKRCTAKKPMIVTSNISAEEFLRANNLAKSRVYSRLSEMCVPVSVEGTDRRREQLMMDAARDITEFLKAGAM